MSYMGVDVGTTGCKAVVFESGRQIALAYREYPLLAPHSGWAELDSADVCEKCFAVIREAAKAAAADPVRSLGICSQGEAFTPVGADGEFLGNAMVSSDARAALIADTWSAEFGRDKLYQATGHAAHPMFTLFKLLWLRENQPQTWAVARRFHCFEDLLHLRLGLDPAISWPLAGRTMLFNVRTHDWDDAILDAAGLDRGRLARTLPSGAVVGTIPSDIARGLALPDDVAVVAAGHDQVCAALGAGVTTEGSAMYATGSVECICPAFDEPRFSDELFRSNLCTYDYSVEGMYATVAFSLTGGNLLKWFRDQWAQREVEDAAAAGADAYDLLMSTMPAEPTDLLVLPYFTPSGTPYFDAHTTGAILGLRLSTTREEVLRALLEGVAFEMRLNLDILERSGIRVDELIASGGGAKSRILLQLKADVLGKPITTLAITETGCFGAALLARSADTGTPVRKLADELIIKTDRIEPAPDRAARYAERFAAYKLLYPALRPLQAE
jgi:xylulokinase